MLLRTHERMSYIPVMTRTMQHISRISTALLLLFATSGIPVIQHLCSMASAPMRAEASLLPGGHSADACCCASRPGSAELPAPSAPMLASHCCSSVDATMQVKDAFFSTGVERVNAPMPAFGVVPEFLSAGADHRAEELLHMTCDSSPPHVLPPCTLNTALRI